MQSITIETPDGNFHIIIDSEGVARVSGFGRLEELLKRLPEDLQGLSVKPVKNHPYEVYVKDYYEGNIAALNFIPKDQNGTDFQKRVWKAIEQIPEGKTISYKQLSEASGNPAAVRAAGTICGLNRLILLIPCHRVLKSDGSIGSYLHGSAIKESLLRHEHAI